MLKTTISALLITLPLVTVPASAKGCIKGAVAGGVAGHYAGHHAVAGAMAGCVAGHYVAKHHDRQVATRPVATTTPTAATVQR